MSTLLLSLLDGSWHKHVRNVGILVYEHASFDCSVNTSAKRNRFLFRLFAVQGVAMLSRSLPMKSWKRLARDAVDAFVSHACVLILTRQLVPDPQGFS